MRIWLASIVFIALLLGRPCMAEYQQTTAHTSNAEAAKEIKPIPPTHVVIDPPLPPSGSQPKTPDGQSQTQEKTLPRFERPEWVIVYITAIYVLIAWWTLRTIKRQADTMDVQAAEAKKSGADTLAAIKRQADSMEKQAAHMESQIAEARSQVALVVQQNQNARDRERARLVIRHMEIPELFPPNSTINGGRALKVRVIVENLGESRAFNVRAWGMMNIVSDREGDDYDVGLRQVFPSIIDADHEKHFLNVTGLGRYFEGVATTGDYASITEELAQRIRCGEVFIAASGTLVYEDIFLDTYETPFHFVWHSFGNDDGGIWLTESYWLDRCPRERRVRSDKTKEDKSQYPN